MTARGFIRFDAWLDHARRDDTLCRSELPAPSNAPIPGLCWLRTHYLRALKRSYSPYACGAVEESPRMMVGCGHSATEVA